MPDRDLSNKDRAVPDEPYDWLKMLVGYLPAVIGGSSGLGLLASSMWLISRAAQHPNVQALSIAVVGVRTFAISPGQPYDPKGQYSVPKDWGTTGFIYRTDKVPEKPKTWREFVNLTMTKYSGKVTLLDGVQEVVGSLAIMLGYSYNTEDQKQLDEVKKLMLKLKPHLLALTSTEYKQQLIAGKTVMAMGWNGDGAAVEVDGGIDPGTAARCLSAGASVFVAGSAIFDAAEPGEAYREIALAVGAE